MINYFTVARVLISRELACCPHPTNKNKEKINGCQKKGEWTNATDWENYRNFIFLLFCDYFWLFKERVISNLHNHNILRPKVKKNIKNLHKKSCEFPPRVQGEDLEKGT